MRRLVPTLLLAALAVLAASLGLPAPSAVGEARQVLPLLVDR